MLVGMQLVLIILSLVLMSDMETTSAPYSSGENNIAVGHEALKVFTTGYNNTILGYR